MAAVSVKRSILLIIIWLIMELIVKQTQKTKAKEVK